jgi:hypothetical protein
MVLDWLPTGVPGLAPKRRFAGLCLRATDQDWTWGDGDEVVGTSEALALAMTGRAVALDELAGSGVPRLRERVSAASLRGGSVWSRSWTTSASSR